MTFMVTILQATSYYKVPCYDHTMMMLFQGNTFRTTVWGKSTSHWCLPLTKAVMRSFGVIFVGSLASCWTNSWVSSDLRCCDANYLSVISQGIHLHFNTLRPGQYGRHFADDIFKCIFLNENVKNSLKISLKFVQINNIPALVQIMAWRQPCAKRLSEPMMVSLLTHICVTRPQCVKSWVFSLMTSLQPTLQHQAISWINADHFVWHLMVSPGVNKLQLIKPGEYWNFRLCNYSRVWL